jgi:hypothetical protein
MTTSLMQMQASLGGEVHGAGPLLLRFLQVFGSPPEPRDSLPHSSGMGSLYAVLLDQANTLHIRPVARRLLSSMSPAGGAAGECGIALLVQDPNVGLSTLQNNVAAGAFNFHLVQSMLRDALAWLERALQEPPGEDPSGLVRSLLDATSSTPPPPDSA